MEEKIFMKGYKAFDKGMICNDKQYAENTVFEEDEAVICEKGIHFCTNPMDCMNSYHSTTDIEFAEVEALAKCICMKDAIDSEHCTTKLRVGKKLSLKEFIDICVEYNKPNDDGDNSHLVSSESYSHLASGEEGSQLASTGYHSNLASSGYFSNLASSGWCSNLSSSGDGSNLASSGWYSKLSSNGDFSHLASSGDNSKLLSGGDFSILSSTGNGSIISNIGIGGYAKGIKGTWITLAEYSDTGECICVKTGRIDGDILKENTWYTLKNGEFVAVKI